MPKPSLLLTSVSISPKTNATVYDDKRWFSRGHKKLLLGIIGGYGISVFVVLYMITSLKAETDNSWIYTLVLITPVLCFTTYRNLKRQKKMFESYRLTISDDAVTREQDNTPTITIPNNRIRRIIRTTAGMYCVIGESQLNAIAIPAQIEDRDDLERLLSGIMPITAKTSWVTLQWFFLAIVMLAFLAACMGLLSEDRVIFTVSALAICAFLIWGFAIIQRSKNFDRRMKRMSYFTIIPFLAILANMIMQWMEG